MNRICRWFGHKRYPLDGDGNGVSIRNIDGCRRCGVILKARKGRGPVRELRALLATELVGLAVKVDAQQVYEMARGLVIAVHRGGPVQHPSSHTSQEGTATN